MQSVPTSIPSLLLFEPKVFGDARGFFFESYNERLFQQLTGTTVSFVQDNHSRSQQGVLRGLHYQIQHPQGKLVRVVKGSVYDVAVDLRRESPTFGKWFGTVLSEANQRLFWVPPGFAHGFIVTSESADFLYKTTAYWSPEHERCIAWNDPDLAIDWPLHALSNGQPHSVAPSLSAKDALGKRFRDAEYY